MQISLDILCLHIFFLQNDVTFVLANYNCVEDVFDVEDYGVCF